MDINKELLTHLNGVSMETYTVEFTNAFTGLPDTVTGSVVWLLGFIMPKETILSVVKV